MDGDAVETVERQFAEMREKLTAELEDINREEEALSARREGIERALAGIHAYIEIQEHGVPVAAPVSKPRKQRASSGKRAGRGQVRDDILNLVRQTDEGLSSKEIIEALGQGDNPQGKQSINSALANMKRAGQLIKSGERGGRYQVAPE